jgi:hypothetical protein
MRFDRPTCDRLMSLPDATTYLRGLTGKKPHISTIWRWCLKGCKGVRLESICVGGRRMVSAAAIDRFIDDCTRRQTAPEAQPVVPRPQLAAHVMRHNERRRAEIEAARRRVDELTGVTKRVAAGRAAVDSPCGGPASRPASASRPADAPDRPELSPG